MAGVIPKKRTAKSAERIVRGGSSVGDLTLQDAVAVFSPLYAVREQLSDPLALIVWENIGYLIDDERRNSLFEEFLDRIGLEPARIANAAMPVLTDIARRGGMNPQTRVERLKRIGELAIAECDGDLAGRLRSLPLAKARTLLKKFPAIGDPGADKILLFAGIVVLPALDSNGVRALVRMGFCAEEKSYAQTCRAAIAVLAKDGKPDAAWLKRAYAILREHGKALCKRSAPICEPCPLDRQCAHRTVSRL
jgi:endonuclease III